ncbi:hypothetical protein COU74_03075 [Candidatus Peregrinibacteria bacterium CG10_big_fil_rev_8_21_14_0_10_36_19]|nr:MAG: hypothetical protein COU74_03075 [Candidatus Peregrinibacteria bacterium CG10_big_fil_rev_8_21_14_0_10_36_19]
MAINEGEIQKKIEGEDSLAIEFDNGDLKALNDIQQKWKFKDKSSLLKFAMAVLLKAEKNTLKISVDGSETEVFPKEDLLITDQISHGKQQEG